jgi:NAD(P)-dependent dehydrogenase (short-subunit alcohol dehydrogenase family)
MSEDLRPLTANSPVEDQATGWQERVVPGRFDGRTVIVTGAASGIGRATASRVLREGGRVVAVDVSHERLDIFAADAGSADLVTVAADITDATGIDRIMTAAGPRVDGLANVAGIADDFSAAHEVTDEVWQRVFAVNVDGTFRLIRAVVPSMLEAGGGSIVNVASEAALRGSAAGIAYTASKHAVVGITRSCALMYAPHQGLPRSHPVHRHRAAARRVDHVPARRRRGQHQRRRIAVGRRLVRSVGRGRLAVSAAG